MYHLVLDGLKVRPTPRGRANKDNKVRNPTWYKMYKDYLGGLYEIYLPEDIFFEQVSIITLLKGTYKGDNDNIFKAVPDSLKDSKIIKDDSRKHVIHSCQINWLESPVIGMEVWLIPGGDIGAIAQILLDLDKKIR